MFFSGAQCIIINFLFLFVTVKTVCNDNMTVMMMMMCVYLQLCDSRAVHWGKKSLWPQSVVGIPVRRVQSEQVVSEHWW